MCCLCSSLAMLPNAPWSKSSSGRLPQKEMAQLKNSKNIRENVVLLFPFHKRGGAWGQCVSCSKVVSAASGREENCIGIS